RRGPAATRRRPGRSAGWRFDRAAQRGRAAARHLRRRAWPDDRDGGRCGHEGDHAAAQVQCGVERLMTWARVAEGRSAPPAGDAARPGPGAWVTALVVDAEIPALDELTYLLRAMPARSRGHAGRR